MKNNMKNRIIATAIAVMMIPAMSIAQDVNMGITMKLDETVDPLDMTLESDSLFDMAAESDSALDEVRGTFGTSLNAETLGIALLSGVSQGNTTNGGVTGANNISGNAFNDVSGLSFVVQNSGNNSVVNAAMVVNLSVTQ